MARYTEGRRDAIDATITLWKQRCLLADESLTQDDAPGTWSLENILNLHQRFNGNPLAGEAGGGRFLSKWLQQLAGASEPVRLLAAEMLLVHFLFAGSVTQRGKLRIINETLEGTRLTLATESTSVRALDQSIGDPGPGFNLRRDLQLSYLIDFVYRLKQASIDERSKSISDPWLLRDFADDTDLPIREMRHVILHLLLPDDFERISSGTHKRQIAEAFGQLLEDGAPDDNDERLLAIRHELSKLLPDGNTHPDVEIDFYYSPLQAVWRSTGAEESEGTGDLEALVWKKQLILYGPPGTSKTFQARNLAETIIRREALLQWGPKAFFSQSQLVDRLVKENIFWVQLHPAFGYTEFIRGLQLDGDRTRYQAGLLPAIVDHTKAQDHGDGLAPLPVVLVLDEINRTDLSAMFGEAFSLLEAGQRGRSVTLPGINYGEEPETLALPPNLYVIGTMNEIDQSVETLDFALRRRFLWRECPFARDALLEIIDESWSRDIPTKFRYEDAADQIHFFADQAEALNRAIDQSDELGRAYEIGHTYFSDITFFLGTWLKGRKNRPANDTYLWKANGAPQPPLINLWERSIKPLLEQYLAGSDRRDEQLRELSKAYYGQ